MAEAQRNIRSLSLESLRSIFVESKLPAFRANQVYAWVWERNIQDFSEINNIGKETIAFIEREFTLDKLTLINQQISSDKTIKCGFKTIDEQVIESVLIPTSKRMTACISSQAGCSLACKFCATGKIKMTKNLHSYELVDQVVYLNELAQEKYGIPLSNIVLMGMGEPLLNYNNVITAMNILSDPERYNISPRRITLSTAGIAKMIRKLGDDEVRFNLALSLHAAEDEKRSQVMEINDSNNLEALSAALEYYYQKTNNRVTFEYILFKNFNDGLEDAAKLAEFARCVPCKINLIEYNPIGDPLFQRAEDEKTNQFKLFLERRNMVVNLRRSRGKDIDAACGQLANKVGN
ncbi:MAG: hypothetical protein RL110_1328 [Bacteroidota bacterium]|jgi:23S rRNA (adenine2503-C2)-methyltransferase